MVSIKLNILVFKGAFLSAGLNEKDNAWEIESYFQSMLFELNYTLPSKLKAVKILLHYYLNKIISNPNKVYSLMKIINNDIYYQIDSEENNQIKKKKKNKFQPQCSHLSYC